MWSKFCVICFSVAIAHFGFAEEPKDFFLLTIPKSGSYMAVKFLTMLTKRPNSNEVHDLFKHGEKIANYGYEHLAAKFLDRSCFQSSHFNCSEICRFLSVNYPELVGIINIRDLRDCYVSLVFYQDTKLTELLGKEASFDDKLSHLLRITPEQPYIVDGIYNLAKMAEEACYWIKQPSVIVIRFEDLVGKDGGGDENTQNIAMKKYAAALNMEMTAEDLENFKTSLFGGTKTFREGKIGGWKNVFNHDHRELFKKNGE